MTCGMPIELQYFAAKETFPPICDICGNPNNHVGTEEDDAQAQGRKARCIRQDCFDSKVSVVTFGTNSKTGKLGRKQGGAVAEILKKKVIATTIPLHATGISATTKQAQWETAAVPGPSSYSASLNPLLIFKDSLHNKDLLIQLIMDLFNLLANKILILTVQLTFPVLMKRHVKWSNHLGQLWMCHRMGIVDIMLYKKGYLT